MNEQAKPPFPKQKQPMPGKTDAMEPVPDHGEFFQAGEDAPNELVRVVGYLNVQ